MAASLGCRTPSSGVIPFPGPGLAIRIPGDITEEKLDILREADAIYLEEIRKAGLYDDDLAGLRRAAAGADRRRDGRCAHLRLRLRAARRDLDRWHDGGLFRLLPRLSGARGDRRIINEVRGINRVVYDITSKPPGTIEWE